MISAGTVLQDTYRIEAAVGKGGMGVVYRASHVRLPKQFAIKVLQIDASKDGGAFARFRREAEIASRIGHPNIVEVHDFNLTADGQPYIVMELLEGHDLATRLTREGRIPVERTLTLAQPIARALVAAHAAGVVHRDLKPQNVFLAHRVDTEVVKILDFGISKILGATDMATGSSETMGTPGYMSPEQARGDSATVDARSDQFSFGAILHQMLTGQHPFVQPGDSVYRVLLRIVHDEPKPLDGVPEPVARVVRRAMAKERDARFPDLRALLRALELAVLGHSETPEGPVVPSVAPLDVAQVAAAEEALGLAQTTPHTPSELALTDSQRAHVASGVLHRSQAGGASAGVVAAGRAATMPASQPAAPAAAASTAPAAATATGDVAAERAPSQPARSWRFSPGYLIAPLLVVGIVIASRWSRTRETPPAPGTAAAPGAASTGATPTATGGATTAPAGAAAATGTPSAASPHGGTAPVAHVAVKLVITPREARALLDGKPVAGDALELVRGAPQPTLVVDAPGYAPRTLTVATDADSTIAVALAPHRAGKPRRASSSGKPPHAGAQPGDDGLDDPFSKPSP